MYTIVQGVGDSLPNVIKFNEDLCKKVTIGMGLNKFINKTDAMLILQKLRKIFHKENFGLARVVGVEALREYINCKVAISPDNYSEVFLSIRDSDLHLLVGLNPIVLKSSSDPFPNHSILSYLVETYGQEWSLANHTSLELARLRVKLKEQHLLIANAEEKAASIYADIRLLKRKMYKG